MYAVNTLSYLMDFAYGYSKLEERIAQFNNPRAIIPEKIIRGSSIALKTSLLALNLIQSIMILRSASTPSLLQMKEWEASIREMDIPTSITNALVDYDRGYISLSSAIEQGLFVPVTDFAKTISDKGMLEEKKYIEMLKADPSNAQRPVYEWDDEGDCMVKTYKPIDLKECEANLKDFNLQYNARSVASLLFHMGIFDKTTAFYYNLTQTLSQPPQQQQPQQQQPQQQQVQQQPTDFETRQQQITQYVQHFDNRFPVQPFNDDPFDLLSKDSLPQPLHNDRILSQKICQITHNPIRFIVGDPDGIHFYERSAIRQWLNTGHFRSPVTYTDLQVNDLRQLPTTQALIDARLGEHQRAVNNVVRLILRRPLSQQNQQLERDALNEIRGTSVTTSTSTQGQDNQS